MRDDWDEDRTSPLSGTTGSLYILTSSKKRAPKPRPIGFIHFTDKKAPHERVPVRGKSSRGRKGTRGVGKPR